MQIPLKITWRNLEQSPSLEANVRKHAGKLEKFYDGIIGCSVVVEARHKHHRQGNQFHVRIDLSVPRAKLVASREPDQHHGYTDVHVALRDAFDSMHRQLEDHARQHDSRRKVHAAANPNRATRAR